MGLSFWDKMTTTCDKKGCNRSTKEGNWAMYKLVLAGCTPNKYYKDNPPIELHFCWEHRKEITKIIEEVTYSILLNIRW